MKPILEVSNLNYIYSVGTPFEHKALDNISFSVEPGEFIGIIGHTGSGKSTLMQQLNGLLSPPPVRSCWTAGISGRIKSLPGRPGFGLAWCFSIPNTNCLKRLLKRI